MPYTAMAKDSGRSGGHFLPPILGGGPAGRSGSWHPTNAGRALTKSLNLERVHALPGRPRTPPRRLPWEFCALGLPLGQRAADYGIVIASHYFAARRVRDLFRDLLACAGREAAWRRWSTKPKDVTKLAKAAGT